MIDLTSGYDTDRLLVMGWRSAHGTIPSDQDLPIVVCSLLTGRVTAPLPPSWHGTYDIERATRWIEDRDREGTVLLVVEKDGAAPIGLVFVFEDEGSATGAVDVRLGYLLAESAWGRGLATELVRGFVDVCRGRGARSIAGGVGKSNAASRRVLEKCGFVQAPDQSRSSSEDFFVLTF